MKKITVLLSALVFSATSISATTIAATTPTHVQGTDKFFGNRIIAQNNSGNSQSDRQAISRAYQAINTAFDRRNLSKMGSYYLPEYQSTGLDGKTTNLQQSIQITENLYRNLAKIKTRTQIQKIQFNGQTATVTISYNMDGSIRDANNSSVTRPFSFTGTSRDTWKRTSSGWKLANSRALSFKDASQNVARNQNGNRTRQQTNRNTPRRNPIVYMQAMDKARVLSYSCFAEDRSEDCDRLEDVIKTVNSWCMQGDAKACEVADSLAELVPAMMWSTSKPKI